VERSEQERQRAIRLRLIRSEERRTQFLLTGFDSLDQALGGGLPRGRIVELFGGSGSGKSTLALQIAANCQKNGGTVAWVDAEHVFDASFSANLGVAVSDMPLVCPETAEQALEIAEKLIASGAIDLLVVDSAAALSPRLELVSGVDAGGGLQSRVLASGLQRLAREARKTQAVVLFLNQTRSRGDDAESSAGGAPLKLHAAARIGLTARGNRVSFRILKNKASEGLREGEILRNDVGRFTESL